MDDFGIDLAETGAVLSRDELIEKRERNGQCLTCGQKCFKRKTLNFNKKILSDAILDRLEPITLDGKVLEGRCLICKPLTQEELDERVAQVAAKVAAKLALESAKSENRPRSTLSSNNSNESAPSPTKNDLSHSEFFDQYGMDVTDDSNSDKYSRRHQSGRDSEFSNKNITRRNNSEDGESSRKPLRHRAAGRSTVTLGNTRRGVDRKAITREKYHQHSSFDEQIIGRETHHQPSSFNESTFSDMSVRRSSEGGRARYNNIQGRSIERGGRRGMGVSKIRRKSVRKLMPAKSRKSSSSSGSDDDDDESSGSSSSSSDSDDDDDDSSSGSSSCSEVESDDDDDDDDELPKTNSFPTTTVTSNTSSSPRQRNRKKSNNRNNNITPQEKMQFILDALSDSAIKSVTGLAGVRDARSKLEERLASAKKTKWYASQQIEDAERRQALAAEREDYESADRLGSVIRANSKAVRKQGALCSDIRQKIVKLDKKEETIRGASSSCLMEARAEMRALQDELREVGKEDEGMVERFCEESERLSSDSIRLAKDLKDAEHEEKFLSYKIKELIGEETYQFEKRLEEDSADLLAVNETLQVLRNQLADAEAVAARLNERIAASNKSIEDVKDRHLEELSQLEMKIRSAKGRREILEAENEKISEARDAHDAMVAAHSSEVEKRKKLIVSTDKECLAAIDLEKIVSSAYCVKEARKKNGNDDGDDDDEEGHNKAQGNDADASQVDDIVVHEALVDEKQELLREAETNIDKLLDDISKIEIRVPVLEAKKQMAAAARDFRSAGRASKKIRELTARKEQSLAELKGGAMECEKSARDELEKYTALLKEKKEAVVERGREAGTEKMEWLMETVLRLRSTLTGLASGSAEEEVTYVSVVAGFLIHAQISVLEEEGRALSDKYGGWKDNDYESEAVERFLAPMMDKTKAKIRPRQRKRLSILLEKKIGCKVAKNPKQGGRSRYKDAGEEGKNVEVESV